MPVRSAQVAEHLLTVKFGDVLPGLSALRTTVPNGVELIVLRLQPDQFKFKIALQNNNKGEMVETMGARHNGVVAINGGFFSINKTREKKSVGFLMIGGKIHSAAWRKSGGYLLIEKELISILPTRDGKIPNGDDILQSKPILIEPGGKWAMNSNRAIAKNRTLVCVDHQGEIIIAAIIKGGLSLYEAGWLMRDTNVGGFFNCDSLIAMDGGGSTQIWVKGRVELSFKGVTNVHNAVIIQQR